MVAGMGFWLGASNTHLSDVESFVEEMNSLRETLAHGVTGEVNADTFAAVCKPVGMKAKATAEEKQWRFRQVSTKHRNPANKPNQAEVEAIKRFEEDAALLSFWVRGDDFSSYYRRITVQTTCLACHGEKEQRPDFIKIKYPDDLAHGFKDGDLRGIFSVTVNNEKP